MDGIAFVVSDHAKFQTIVYEQACSWYTIPLICLVLVLVNFSMSGITIIKIYNYYSIIETGVNCKTFRPINKR